MWIWKGAGSKDKKKEKGRCLIHLGLNDGGRGCWFSLNFREKKREKAWGIGRSWVGGMEIKLKGFYDMYVEVVKVEV